MGQNVANQLRGSEDPIVLVIRRIDHSGHSRGARGPFAS